MNFYPAARTTTAVVAPSVGRLLFWRRLRGGDGCVPTERKGGKKEVTIDFVPEEGLPSYTFLAAPGEQTCLCVFHHLP